MSFFLMIQVWITADPACKSRPGSACKFNRTTYYVIEQSLFLLPGGGGRMRKLPYVWT
jgi:hypothetical protein